MPKKGLNLPKQGLFKAPANLFKRALAFAIDLVIVSFLVYPFERVIRKIVPVTGSYAETYTMLANSENTGLLTTVSILISLAAIAYFSILESKLGQTIGKIALKVYVVSENRELKYWQCLVRNLFLLPFIPFILLWVIDPLYAIFTKDNKRFSDILAKTKVIEYYRM